MIGKLEGARPPVPLAPPVARGLATPSAPARAPVDSVQLSARPGAVSRIRALIHRVADTVFYGALSLTGGLPMQALFFSHPPDGLPAPLWKAFHHDETETRAHWERIQRMKCSDSDRAAILDDYAHVERKLRHGTDLRKLLDGIDGQPDAAGYFHDYRRLADRDHNMEQAVADVKLADTQAKAASVSLDESTRMLEALRQGEPATKEDYESFVDLGPALSYVMAGRDASAREQRLSWLQGFQSHHRSVPQALALETAVSALKCDARTRGEARSEFRSIVKHWSASADVALRDGLNAVDGPDPLRGLAWLRTLLGATQRPDRAAADLRMAQGLASQQGIPTEEVVGIVAAMRHADPARGDWYGSFSPIDTALSAVLAEKDAPARRAALDALLSLTVKQRSLVGVVPLYQQLHGVPSSDRLHGDVRHLLKHVPSSQDGAVVDALKDAQARPDPRQAFHEFADLARLTGRPQQALADVRLAAHSAAASGCAPGDVLEVVRELRQADPARHDEYLHYADLSGTLGALLQHPAGTAPPTRGELDDAISRFLRLQKHGRGATEALAHERALAALPGRPDERAAVRERYAKLVKKYASSADPALLAMLGDAARNGSPLQTLERFGRLLDVTGRPQQALLDLQAAQKLAAAHHLDGDECVALVAALRRHDPARKDSYGTFPDPAGAMDYVLAASTAAARSERAERVVEVQKCSRGLDAALKQAQHLDGVTNPAVRSTYGKLLHKYGARWDDALRNALDYVKQQPRPASVLSTYRALAEASRRPDEALQDLKQVTDRASRLGMGLDDVAELVERLRRADPYRGDYYQRTVDLGPALDLALSGPSAREREERARAFARLWKKNESADQSVSDLQWIVSGLRPAHDLGAATDRLLRLKQKVGGPEAALRTLYEHTEAYVEANPPRWWERLLHLHSRYERAVYRVAAFSRASGAVLPLMDSISAGALSGESITGTLKRFRRLLHVEGEYPDIEQVRVAWERFRTPMASGGVPAGEAGWQYFLDMAKSMKSAPAAGLVWSAMARAATPDEMTARRRGYDDLFKSARGQTRDAMRLYEAAARVLGPSDPMNAAVTELQALLKNQRADVAAENFVVARGITGMTDAEKQAVRDILGCARSADEIHGLFSAVSGACGTTALLDRAHILQALLARSTAWSALQGYALVRQELTGPDELKTAGPAGAGLIAVLAQRRMPADSFHSVMAWLRDFRASLPKDDDGVPPLSDMLMSLTSSLLVGGDLASAREQLRAAEERRMRTKTTGNAGGIAYENGAINVDGIRLPVRKASQQ